MDKLTFDGMRDLLASTIKDLLPDREIEVSPNSTRLTILMLFDWLKGSDAIDVEEIKTYCDDPNKFLIFVKSKLQKIYLQIIEQATEQLKKLNVDVNVARMK